MENKGFWGTKAGHLTMAFIVIMLAFILIMVGGAASSDILCAVGFFVIVVAMLYSPVETYLLKRNTKGKKS